MPPGLTEVHGRWWRGKRGEWYVVVQLALFAIVIFAPGTLPGLPVWPVSLARFSAIAGGALMATGTVLLLASLLRLGANLSPLPHPMPGATLVRTGPYRLVRHPIYAAGIMLAYGWALFRHGWLTLAYATLLLVFLDLKSAREERWLAEKFPDYREYQREVRKLFPFLY